jgi:acyl transferase domain-containing protein
MVPNRVSYLLNLRGPSEPIDTACASSLSAIHRAVQEIQLGNCDMAIAGGIKLILSPTLYIAFSKAGMLSEDGKCKTFDKDANGYVRGEGSGAILLKPLRKAIEDNNNIYAVIKGTAINHGGHVNSLTTPSPNAQAEVIIKAWEKANVNPSTVGYIETYGSGTSLGDTIEINGLKKAFKELNNNWGNDNLKSKYCGIGSVKTNIGHLETASGIAGLLKVILAMKNKKLPASINYNEINPYIKLEDSPFYIVENTNKWDKKENEPRRAGVSAFGHGGVNAHIALEEYVAPIMNELDSKDSQIIVLSAKNKDRLKEYVREMIKYIDNTFGNNVDSNIYEETLMNNILNDLKQIVSKTLEVSPNDISVFEEMDTYGFEPLVISEFLQIVSETFKIEKMTLHTNGYTSLKNIANCLLNNYRQNIINYYSNSIIENNCVRSNICLKDMAYTLQVGRDGMNERLAVVVNNIEDLKKKLTMFLEGKKNIDNLYIGTIKGNKVNKKTIELMDGEEGKEFVNLLIKNNKLKKISQLWVTGIEINWEKLNENSNKKRISLPTYPFAKDSYWVTKGEK